MKITPDELSEIISRAEFNAENRGYNRGLKEQSSHHIHDGNEIEKLKATVAAERQMAMLANERARKLEEEMSVIRAKHDCNLSDIAAWYYDSGLQGGDLKKRVDVLLAPHAPGKKASILLT